MHQLRTAALALTTLVIACADPSTPVAAQPSEPTEASETNPWQARAERALDEAGVPGAIVVLDPRDGKLLASAERAGRVEHPASSRRSPGSTVKPFLALAALHEGVLDPREEITCAGEHEIEGEPFFCFAEHGPLDLSGAMATSCNVYAYHLTQRLGIEQVQHTMHGFGFEFEAIASAAPRDASAWKAVFGIGHGPMLVSPMQLARAYAALASGTAPEGHADAWPYTDAELQVLRESLIGVVQSERGTGTEAAIDGLTILGKTGTSDDGDGQTEYRLAWFAGWAPAEDPKIVVVVQLEAGEGTGGDTAAPVARRLFEGLLE